MLELQLVKGSLFHNLLESILDLADVANVDCSSTGLKLQAVDTEDVAIIELLFRAEDFQLYRCDEHLSMGIAIDDMVQAIRSADNDDTITIKVGDENFNTITLSFESPEKNNTTAYDLWLVDAQSHRFTIPDWQVLESKYQAFIQMPSAEFMRICKYLSNIGGNGAISMTEEGLDFFASGKSGSVYIEYMQPEATAAVVNMREPVTLTLDMKYMNSFAKASNLFNQVKICLSTTQPLMVECKIGQMGYFRYFVAPKVEPEIEGEEIKKERERSSGEEKEGKRKGSKSMEEIKEEVSGEKEGKRKRLKRKEENGEVKEGSEDDGNKEREGDRSKSKRKGSKKKAKV